MNVMMFLENKGFVFITNLIKELLLTKMSKNVNDLKGKNRIFPNRALTFCQNPDSNYQRAFLFFYSSEKK